MKRNRLYVALALVLVGLSAGFVACSDDDDAKILDVNGGQDEIRINRLGGDISVPITAEGDWKATLNFGGEKIRWAAVEPAEGNGSGTLELTVDYFNPILQKQQRNAELVLESDGNRQTVSLSQYIGIKEGETAPNADGGFADVWQNKGVGAGYDVTKGHTINPILNMNVIMDMKQNAEYSTIFSEGVNPQGVVTAERLDTVRENWMELGVDCTLDITYATFKLGVKFKYNNEGLQIQNHKSVQSTQRIVFRTANVSSSDLRALFRRGEMKFASIGFADAYAEIVDAEAEDDDESFKACVEAMLESFGPILVTGADLGGSLFADVHYDALTLQDSLGVDGTLVVGVNTGPLQIDANVHVEYFKKGYDFYKTSTYAYEVRGGNQNAISSLSTAIASLDKDSTALVKAADVWLKSITSEGKNTDNAAVVNIRYVPVWDLFPTKIARKIKPIVAEYYKGETICMVNPEELGITE